MKRRVKRRAKSAKRSRRRVSGDQSFAPSIIGRIKRGGKKSRSRRRSKVGALDGAMNTLLGVAAGVAVGILVDKLGDKFAPNLSPKVKSLVKVGGGVALVAMKGNKAIVKGIGMGLAANGVTTAAKDFGILAGVDEFMSGIGAGSDTMTIEMNGTPPNAGVFMNGDEDQVNGEYMSGSNNTMPSVIG